MLEVAGRRFEAVANYLTKRSERVRSRRRDPSGISPRAQLRAQRRRLSPLPRAPPITPAENTFAHRSCWPNNGTATT
ncbi:unnamed protein product [Leptosia nina]|uniref:Uncharacterized protein n=1 Tax=Leptosia nina TaxID=320188 RepID=A0AAV1IUG2_9NEOP